MNPPGRVLLAVALSVAALAAPQARADKAAAKKLTEQATLAYKLGHFQEALEDFSMAYGQFSAPLLLFNIGQCYRELGNYERASFFLRGYLHEIPHAKNRALVEDLIAECETKLAAEQAESRRREEEEKEQLALKLAETNLLAEQQPVIAARAAATLDRASLVAEERAAKTKVGFGIGIGAAGLVAIGLGAYFGVRADSDSNTVTQLAAQGRSWTSSAEGTYRDGSRSAAAADVLFIAGGAAVVAGGVLAVVGWRQGSSAKKALAIAGLSSSNRNQPSLAWSF